jgi:hypothetical protein
VRVSLRPVNADKTQRDPQKPARGIRASSDHKWQSETPFPHRITQQKKNCTMGTRPNYWHKFLPLATVFCKRPKRSPASVQPASSVYLFIETSDSKAAFASASVQTCVRAGAP